MNRQEITTNIDGGKISVGIDNDMKQAYITFTTANGDIIDLASVDIAVMERGKMAACHELPPDERYGYNALRLQLFADPGTEDPTDTKYIRIEELNRAFM